MISPHFTNVQSPEVSISGCLPLQCGWRRYGLPTPRCLRRACHSNAALLSPWASWVATAEKTFEDWCSHHGSWQKNGHVAIYGYVWKWGITVYPQWNSHLVGIMISKTIGFFGVHDIFRQTHIEIPGRFFHDHIKWCSCHGHGGFHDWTSPHIGKVQVEGPAQKARPVNETQHPANYAAQWRRTQIDPCDLVTAPGRNGNLWKYDIHPGATQ